MEFWEFVNTLTGGRIKEHFREAATAYDDDPKASEYRRMTGSTRDLTPLKFEQAMRMSFQLWQRNPLARRMIQIMVDFCTGDDFHVDVKIKKRVKGPDEDTGREDAQKIWDDTVSHPFNQLDKEWPTFFQDALLNGELVLPVNVNKKDTGEGTFTGDGTVIFGYIDPLNIVEVVPMKNNIRFIETIITTPPGSSVRIPLKVVKYDMEIGSESYKKLMGEVIYWRLYRVTNQTRGTGLLVDSIDWLDALDQFLFDALSGYRARNAFFWDVLLEGADEAKIEEEAKKIKAPRSGTVRVHNEKATYEAKSPTLGAAEADRALQSFQTFVVGNKGFPMHWFGSAADANLATAKQMDTPVMRMMKSAQTMLKHFVEHLVQFVCDQAVLAKMLTLSKDEYVDVTVNMFDFERADAAVIGLGFVQVVTALLQGIDAGLVKDEDAKKVLDGLMQRLGVTVDATLTPEVLKSEKAQRDAENIYNDNPPPGNMPAGKSAFGKKPAVVPGNGQGEEVPI